MDTALFNRNVEIVFTKKAQKMLQKRPMPLFIDMELFFSCLIRKRVLFSDEIPERAVRISNNVYIGFHPVMTKSCDMDSFVGKPALTDFPIKKPDGFIPHWLKVDYKKGQWTGEFGYAMN